MLVKFHFEDTCYGEAWSNLYQLVEPLLKTFNEDFCVCFTPLLSEKGASTTAFWTGKPSGSPAFLPSPDSNVVAFCHSYCR